MPGSGLARRAAGIALPVLAVLMPSLAAAQQAGETGTLPPVVVTTTRSESAAFDLPMSADRIEGETIRQGNAMVNLSESLSRLPGIVVQNRQNYAQDLQISSRGFGARSTFGVRGVRLYADGIPATMPDGQGQTSAFDLASASRIEVLRGPFSALYGNSSGGVIALFTEDGGPGHAISPYLRSGSYGTLHSGIMASGQQDLARGSVNYTGNLSHFETDGYRAHSAASRDIFNGRLRFMPSSDTAVTIIGNAVSLPDVQDPLGLSRAQWQADPRSVDPAALTFDTRKSVSQRQAGMRVEKTLGGGDAIEAMAYAGARSTEQFQAIPVAAQAAPTSAGGMIDLQRRYGGLDLRWVRKSSGDYGNWQWTAGIAADTLDEDRKGFENFANGTLGVQGRLRRDEDNRVHNVDQYLQAQWEPGPRWLLLAGLRHSDVRVRSQDNFIAPGNGDDSGSTRFHAVTPVLGATYRLTPATNLYASYGRGFETPTLNELSYRPGGAPGLNTALRAAKSDNAEAGIKTFLGPRWRLNLALFHIDTDDEIAVLSNTGGRAVFQNAGRTRRDGMELALQGHWDNGFEALFSWSLLHAVYAQGFCPAPCTAANRVAAGNRIPGVPASSAYTELAWRHRATGFSVALEGRYVGSIPVDDIGSERAPAYTVANLRAGIERRAGNWRWEGFVRVDNLADRDIIGSVIVNEGNRRFYEPAPGRNVLAGVSATWFW